MTMYPNWVNLDVIKSPMYLNLKDVDDTRDNALVLLCQMVTEEMICYLDNPDIDESSPPMALVRAALKQTCYEWKQRATPGLQSVQMQDGSINKYQIDEWLKDVEKVLKRHMRYVLHETSTTAIVYTDPEAEFDPSGPTGAVPPSAPILSSATAGNARVTLVWSPVSDAVSYNVYYKIGTTVDKNTGTKVAGAVSGDDIVALTNDTEYAFAVSAVNTNGESALSNIKTATPTAPVVELDADFTYIIHSGVV